MSCTDIPTPSSCRPVYAGVGAGTLPTYRAPGEEFATAYKSDGLFTTASTAPVPVTGWSLPLEVPEGRWNVDAYASGFTEDLTPVIPAHLALYARIPVSAASRTSNVVTLTVPAGHGLRVGSRLLVDLSDNTFDVATDIGSAPAIATSGATTVTFPQTASNDADGGTGFVAVRIGVTASIFRNAQAIAHAALPDSVMWAPAAGLAVTIVPYLRTDNATSDANINAADLGAFGNGPNVVVLAATKV